MRAGIQPRTRRHGSAAGVTARGVGRLASRGARRGPGRRRSHYYLVFAAPAARARRAWWRERTAGGPRRARWRVARGRGRWRGFFAGSPFLLVEPGTAAARHRRESAASSWTVRSKLGGVFPSAGRLRARCSWTDATGWPVAATGRRSACVTAMRGPATWRVLLAGVPGGVPALHQQHRRGHAVPEPRAALLSRSSRRAGIEGPWRAPDARAADDRAGRSPCARGTPRRPASVEVGRPSARPTRGRLALEYIGTRYRPGSTVLVQPTLGPARAVEGRPRRGAARAPRRRAASVDEVPDAARDGRVAGAVLPGDPGRAPVGSTWTRSTWTRPELAGRPALQPVRRLGVQDVVLKRTMA